MYKTYTGVLCDLTKIAVKDKDTGEMLTRWKHEILLDDGQVKVGYTENDGFKEYLDPARGVVGYRKEKERRWIFKVREFEGKQSEALQDRVVSDAMLREVDNQQKS